MEKLTSMTSCFCSSAVWNGAKTGSLRSKSFAAKFNALNVSLYSFIWTSGMLSSLSLAARQKKKDVNESVWL